MGTQTRLGVQGDSSKFQIVCLPFEPALYIRSGGGGGQQMGMGSAWYY